MSRRSVLPLLSAVALAAGGLTAALAGSEAGRRVWFVGLVATGAPVLWSTLRAARRGQFAVDIVAALSIVGAVALDQPFAGLVIVLMQTGGESLERFAEGRASRAVRALEEASPRIARRIDTAGITDVPATEIAVGDQLMIRPGDLVPCDGVVLEGTSELDESSLTGESIPVAAIPGVRVMSGTLNGSGALRMRVTAVANRSQYARIVELVRSAQSSKPPLQRIADRYAAWFTPLTLVVCAIVLAITHSGTRALAVLVVATPCPLILAAPVAFVGGINRAARHRIIVRTGGALEHLARVNAVLFDKTGTITVGAPTVRAVHAVTGFTSDEILRWCAAVEQGSSHRLGRVLVDYADARKLQPARATGIVETAGKGVEGVVDGRRVRVGARDFALSSAESMHTAALEQQDASLRAYVAVDDRLAGIIEYVDEPRADLPALLDWLAAHGVRRLALISGDHELITRTLAQRVGIADAHGDMSPADKSRFVQRLQGDGHTVMMIGDGTNDAPALAVADLGVALAAHGGGVTAEAADVVILADELSLVADAMEIGGRTMRIALQSIRFGLGLSGVAMIVAAFGGLAPSVGAVLQEVIDLAVILNALRSARDPRHGRGRELPDKKTSNSARVRGSRRTEPAVANR